MVNYLNCISRERMFPTSDLLLSGFERFFTEVRRIVKLNFFLQQNISYKRDSTYSYEYFSSILFITSLSSASPCETHLSHTALRFVSVFRLSEISWCFHDLTSSLPLVSSGKKTRRHHVPPRKLPNSWDNSTWIRCILCT